MSEDQIINSWKNEDEEPGGKKRKEDARKPALPTNPAGLQELSDNDLESIEGGAGRLIGGSIDTCGTTPGLA